MTYEQIVIQNQKAKCEWKATNWDLWKGVSPDAEIIEETNSLLIIKVPAHEYRDKHRSELVPETYAIYGVHELRLHNGFRIYWEPDLYHEVETIEEAKNYEETISLRNTPLAQIYDLSGELK